MTRRQETTDELYQALTYHEKMLFEEILSPRRGVNAGYNKDGADYLTKTLGTTSSSLDGLVEDTEEDEEPRDDDQTVEEEEVHDEETKRPDDSQDSDEISLQMDEVTQEDSTVKSVQSSRSLPHKSVEEHYDCHDGQDCNSMAKSSAASRSLYIADDELEFHRAIERSNPNPNRNHSLSKSVVGAFSLRNVVSSKEGTIRRILKGGSNRESKNEHKISYRSMRAILNSLIKSSANELKREDMESVAQCIRECNDPKVLQVAVTVLGCLAAVEDETNRQYVENCNCGVVHLLGCMNRFAPTKEKGLHEECVIALYKLTRHPEDAVEFGYSLGIPTLLKTMQAYKTNLKIQKHAFGTILRTAEAQPTYVATKPEIFDLLVAVMNVHRACPQFQKLGCILLHKLAQISREEASNDSFDEDLFVSTMINAGVVSCLITSVRAHSHNLDVLRLAFSTCHILCIHTTSASETAKSIVARGTDFCAILQILKAHELKVCVQREGFKLLRSLQNLPAICFGPVPEHMLTDAAIRNILVRAGLWAKFNPVSSQISIHSGSDKKGPRLRLSKGTSGSGVDCDVSVKTT